MILGSSGGGLMDAGTTAKIAPGAILMSFAVST